MRRTTEKRIEKLVMSTYLFKYEICSIFLLCAIGSSVVSAQGFCELMSYVKPSTPFSFEKQVMKLRGFTYYENDGHLVMFYDDSFQLISDGELNQKPENIQIFKNSTFSTFDRFSFLKTYFVDQFSSDEQYDTMYYLDANPSFIFATNIIAFAFSNKRSIAFDNSVFKWIQSQTTPIKLITDSLNINMKVYANGVDPVAKKGIIFYKFWFSAGTYFFYTFAYKVINDASDLKSESYFYLQLTTDPSAVKFVHPRTGNITAARLYPLAQRAIPGYIYKKNLFLFDVDLGCVHVLPNFDLINLNALFKRKSDFLLKRRNIPFEKFFICDPKYEIPKKFSFLSSDRCETKIDFGGLVYGGRSVTEEGNVEANDNTDDNVLVLTGSNEEPSSKMRNNTFFAIVTILVVICSVVLCLLLIWRHKKRNKNSKNQSIVEKARSKKTTSVGKKGGGAGGDLKVWSKSKSKIKQRSQKSSGGGVPWKKSAKSSKSSTSTPVTTSSAGF